MLCIFNVMYINLMYILYFSDNKYIKQKKNFMRLSCLLEEVIWNL